MPADEYFSIPSSSICPNLILDFDLFKRELVDGKNRYSLAFGERFPAITTESLQELNENGVRNFFIPMSESGNFCEYLSRNLKRIIIDSEITEREKARVLFYSAKLYVRKWFEHAKIGPLLESSREVVEHIVRYVLRDDKSFYNFFDIDGDTRYLFSHSLNVAIYGLAILNAMGKVGSGLPEAYSYGALLHDVGMREVPESIIEKPAILTPDEYKLVRKHPSIGARLAAEAGGLPGPGDIVVKQHHERLNGKGYPWGLPSDDIHPLARICAVADVFDALTTTRSYRKPVTSFEAFRMMKIDGASEFDQKVLETFIRLMTA
ncbi:MAG: HD domain-containing protein [Planctomycetota bacterium]|nr:MAG: HD domain-containing protein [Planctomycetota bacterium]